MSSADTIYLWHGIQRESENVRFSVNDIYRDPDSSVMVRLVSVAEEEQRHVLQVGETFIVGNETWQLADLEGWPSDHDWTVVLRRLTSPSHT